MLQLNKIAFDGLQPVSMRIEAGECIGLSGISGCGKTRLLRILADMDEHEGAVVLDGIHADDIPANEWRMQVALLPAESQWWYDSVGEHFADVTVDLSTLGFEQDTYGWQVSRCSSGEKQRLSILRCLANHPKVLLLDEPTANLDPDNAVRVEAPICQYVKDNNAVCIWVSHNQLQLERVTSRCYQFIDNVVCEVTV